MTEAEAEAEAQAEGPQGPALTLTFAATLLQLRGSRHSACPGRTPAGDVLCFNGTGGAAGARRGSVAVPPDATCHVLIPCVQLRLDGN